MKHFIISTLIYFLFVSILLLPFWLPDNIVYSHKVVEKDIINKPFEIWLEISIFIIFILGYLKIYNWSEKLTDKILK